MALRTSLISTVAALALAGTPALAQSNWEFEGSFYLFTAETKTGSGNADVELSFSDALDNLDMAFMGTFGASNGQWSFVADYMMTDLTFNSDVRSRGLFSGAKVSVKTQVLTGLGFYRVHEAGGTSIDLGAGFRWYDTDTTLKLKPGIAPGRTRRTNDNWTDPIIAARARFDIARKWRGTAVIDYGNFIDDRKTWGLVLTADYAFAENWVARIGYRYLSVENDEDGQDYSFEQSGPVLGVTYRF